MNLIPFFLVSLYGFLVAKRGETYNIRPEERTRDLIIASIAVIYTAFLIYAAGFKFLVLAAILYGPGAILYFWTRREQGKKVFAPIEWFIFIVTIVLCVVGIHGLVTGYITI
jgi:arginine:ornithine antiporter / lysine permease